MDAVGAVSALNDPVRAAIYDIVASHDAPVSRDLIAEALDLPRSTAAFHLDRLAATGLVAVSYLKPAGRRGPGSGRPAKHYELVADELVVSLPERRYDLMGSLLASAIERSAEQGRPVLGVLRETAAEAGRETGRAAASFGAALDAEGYSPVVTPDGHDTVMMNCPFHRLATTHTDVVCTANHAFLCGVAEATGRDADDVLLEPGAGRCCVRVVGAQAAGRPLR